MAEAEGGSEQDDVSFLRTEDMVTLSCTATGERVCLAAEGFGNRHCFLENIADKNVPPDLSQCVFVIEQALSVRALQELVTAAGSETGKGTGSGHRTLLYGNAILLRHHNSDMYLACLSTSSSNDKLSFDVGLQEHSQGEACWWTVHPASKQRSEGEKVRVGDDLILVSVATERYLHTTKENEQSIVNASFHVTHWSVQPYGTGISRMKYVGYVFGGDVLRFFHGGDECLTIPSTWGREAGQNIVIYEGGVVMAQARSLWRLELARTKWTGGFINWYHPMRIRHITTGRYLGVNDSNELILVKKEEASIATTTFCLRQEKDDEKKVLEDKDLEVIGSPIIKYGDTTVIVQHCETSLWLSYKSYETKKKGVGKVEEKQAILHEEGKMDDCLDFSRSQEEESKTARVIRKCSSLFTQFITALETLQSNRRHSIFFQKVNLNEMVMCLEDLINYFSQPEDDMEHEEKQNRFRALRNRQDLFQEEGVLNLILEAIDKINIITSQGFLASFLAGDETGQSWDLISTYLYQLLAAIIKGNHTNCAQFANSNRLNWLFSRLGSQASSEGSGMLDVLHCVLIDSPEALNMMRDEHIKVIISLLEKHGRDPKVLDVLCSLCVGNGVAVRSSQNNICDFLLPGKNLLLQTLLVDHVASIRPNIFVGRVDGSSMYQKWYFEVTMDHIEQTTHMMPHLRIGWANTSGYVPYPGGGKKWGGNGVGDDLYSFGFDGAYLWTGGRKTLVMDALPEEPFIRKGDVVGVAIDLSVPIITFTFNGVKVRGSFRDFNLDGMFFPVMSCSSKLSCRFLFGGDHGRLKFAPPMGFSALVQCLMPQQILSLDPCFYFGNLSKNVLAGPWLIEDDTAFVPKPVDTTGVTLPSSVDQIKEKLAENIHEMWALNKIEAGWSWGEHRDDYHRIHPCLTHFEKLPAAEKRYDNQLAVQTLKTIISLGYYITMDKPPARIRPVRLPNEIFMQGNGYKPAPLDLSAVTLTPKLEELVDQLAENTHNLWARERIQQGWTYGLNEDSENHRSPHLVPYAKVDEAIKKANRDTASETVRTLLVYGYVLDPPTGEGTEALLAEAQRLKFAGFRTYRVERNYAVTSGKWYFEFEVLTSGPMRVGWARADCYPGAMLGSEDTSWAFDGHNVTKMHAGSIEHFGVRYEAGDVIGCFIDVKEQTISFSLNGELLMDALGGETTFADVTAEGVGFVPACTLGVGQKARLIYGQDVDSLKFFTTCGLQEGYEPFCVNMRRPVTHWYTKDQPIFENTEEMPDCRIDVTRIPGGADTPPHLKISHNTFETMEKANWEFLRLSLPVTCMGEFISEQEKARRWDEIKNRQYRLMREAEIAAQMQVQTQAAHMDHMLKGGFNMNDIKGLTRNFDEHADAEADHMMRGPNRPPRKGSLTRNITFETDMSAALDEMQRSTSVLDMNGLGEEMDDKKKRGRSPFKFFSKKSRDQSREKMGARTLDTSLERRNTVAHGRNVVNQQMTTRAPTLRLNNAEIPPSPVPQGPKQLSGSNLGQQPVETSGDEMFDAECLKLINEYFYGVRIFPGQDPTHVYVGWVTTQYHLHSREFNKNNVRRGSVYIEDDYEMAIERIDRLVSAAVLPTSDKHINPQSPPRLKVQCLRPHQWARVPNTALQVHALKLSDVRGWSMLCEDPVSMLALHIPEEDRCIDILELIEMDKLLSFHAHSLTLYAALCYQSNYRAAHALCQHVDQKQLLYAIRSEYMSGPLRQGFYDLLIALHLESHATTMEGVQERVHHTAGSRTQGTVLRRGDAALTEIPGYGVSASAAADDGDHRTDPRHRPIVLPEVPPRSSQAVCHGGAEGCRRDQSGAQPRSHRLDQREPLPPFNQAHRPATLGRRPDRRRCPAAVGHDRPRDLGPSLRERPSKGGAVEEGGVTQAAVELRFSYSLLEKLIQYLDRATINMKLLKPSTTFSRRSSFKTATRDIKFFSKVVLPLMEKYFSTHRNYFIAIATATNNIGAASLKEKEMVASIFCKLAALLRNRLSAFGPDVRITVRCLQVLVKGIDARTLTKNCPEFIRTSMLTFFNQTSDDLGNTILNLQDGKYSHLRGTHLKTSTSLGYVNQVVLPVLTAMFDHLAACDYGSDLLLDEIQVASYKILAALYHLGTDGTLTHDRKYLKTEIERHRPALGSCLGAYSSCFPVAFLEPHLNKHNQYSLLNRIADHSLEAQDIMVKMESCMPNLETILAEVDQFVESDKTYNDAPHIIDVILPLLCAYLPFWWSQGPDNVSPTSGNHVTMVTADHMNPLLRNVLKMIKKNIGNDNAPWMTRIAAYTQQIIINTSEELLKDPFLPLAERVKKRTENMLHKEDSMRGFIKSATDDTSQVETQLQEDWNLLVRDIYSFYPLLIKYVDLQRNHWLKDNIPEAEELYNHVAEIFNIWSKSQYFLKEEQNFISANEIDNMALIMPTATRRSAISEGAPTVGGKVKKKKKNRDKKRDKDKEVQASLMVACLKRLLPVGLNLFAGREQELVQHCKDRYLKKMPEYDVIEFARNQLTLPDKLDPSDEMSWQHYLYSKLGKTEEPVDEQALEKANVNSNEKGKDKTQETVDRIVAMAKVLFGLHMEQEMEKQKLLFHQARLSNRGVAEMVLLHISASKGIPSEMVMTTLNLGIAILRGGNIDIQMGMLNHLKEKKDVGFFTSIAGLMNSCSVLDLDAFERNTKAEGLGVGSEGAAGEKNMHDAEFTCALFRFIQLTCEGHNLEWQNYLRTQAGNTTTVNVVICTVDYLLRLQESIMDFYWHYSSKEIIDPAGKANFFKAIEVASQVFNTLTEVIQGPCTLNQQALAHSRLWDAVGGFLFLFSHMQDKLSKHSSQVDLLKELLNLQKDMITMMLSMLEGNVVNGTIGKQMVDTLVESASNVELILKYFDMFLKLADLIESPSFHEVDMKNEGWVTPKDFREKMEQSKNYTPEEMDFLLACCERNHEGKIDYRAFVEHFHEPSKEIGFNLAVLLTNLSEHMPNEPRLARFLETAGSVLNYFEPFLGRIEILGSSKRIERVYFEIKDSNIEQWEKPQIRESKRAFFYSIVTEGGDKEKLEAFVNFCEDAIFEMTHASGLMATDDGGGNVKRDTAYSSYMSEEEEERAARDPIRRTITAVKEGLKFGVHMLSPANIKHQIGVMQTKSIPELIVGFFKIIFYIFYYTGYAHFCVVRYIFGILLNLMRGPAPEQEEEPVVEEETFGRALPPLPLEEPPGTVQAFGLDINKEENGMYKVVVHESPANSSMEEGGESSPEDGAAASGELVEGEPHQEPISIVDLLGGEAAKKAAQERQEAQKAQEAAMASIEAEAKKSSSAPQETPAVHQIDFSQYTHRAVSFLARNFYNLKYVALVLAFSINFMLLFYKVTSFTEEADSSAEEELILGSGSGGGADITGSGFGGSGDGGSGDSEMEDEIPELVHVDEDFFYMEHVLRIAACLHSLVSLAMLIAYYHLKVPLAIFKREKEIARRLEFEGLFIAEQPEDDDFKSHWDKLVISAKSFPVNYWDKFVKKKVRQKYSETYDFDSISNLLGMEKSTFASQESEETGIFKYIMNIDWRYQVWKAGVTFTDNAFLYSLWYFSFSVMGNFNNFFFAAHLLDVAVGFKTLRTILQSVTHNGKQLVLTVMLLTIIVYIYTVIAFNFFRKFYIQEEDEEVDKKCHDMLTCFVFHLYKGVRAGGGIGDEIGDPDGDDYEVYRIIFDITFFFFVIIILLAIIQGLIIDAFGELRDQLESVKDNMESNCFICGMGKDFFDIVPHGFDTHVQKEHNLANYMFFLMHLINKPDTEYTGQETYVWNMYQQRSWDFFPVGDCFRKQYEDELSGGGGGG
ncbi:GM21070 [Drosophila sechellia]|uniref:GM21070 n=1 Tax=Drosophila sechellia TaxID=7238 RepID=B4HSA0_DROSE|nr:GM21070 [Drosophila sechellia]